MSGQQDMSAPNRPPWVPLAIAIGAGIVLAVGLGLVLGAGGPGPSASPATADASASLAPSPSATESFGPSLGPSLSPAPSASLAPTLGPTLPPIPTVAPTAVPTTRPTATPAPIRPKIDSFTVTPNFIGSCDETTSVTLTWKTTNATEVRISLDPGPQKPIDAVYQSGLPPDGSLPGLSYGCNPTYSDANGGYHEYVVIAVRGNRYVTHSIKVYVHLPT